eukprot:GHVO01065189.1.p1 GENE.GHVO01065189.1~~GHVO01065189.1.p1  ORF type:complete len:171 (+),score=17.73 GHVO01065189.1:15-527(+)
MHTHSARLGALVSTLVICLGIGSTFNYVTSFGWAMNPSGEIGSPKVYSLGTSKELNSDRAILQFSLDADLTSAFQWNTKQLFVYVTAEYETPKNGRNSVVIWDQIIQNKKDAKFSKRASNKYPLTDQHHSTLIGNNITLHLKFSYMPHFGITTDHAVAAALVAFPSRYTG